MAFLSYLRSLAERIFARSTLDRELEEEIFEHVRLRAEALERSGLSREEAERSARIEFGARERLKEECRDARGGTWIDALMCDVRFGLRVLRKSPLFAAVAIVTMAVGIGATTAIFSVVNATLLHPLPFAHPEELVSVEADFPGINGRDVGFSQPEWEDLKRAGIFDDISPSWFDENNLTGGLQPARVRLLLVGPNYFRMLGMKPQMGRTFDAADHSPGIIPEVVISDSLWKRLFGADPNILDKNIRMDTDLYRVVGVMPRGFDAPGRTAEERNIEIWAASSFYGMPLPDHPRRNSRILPTLVGRLKPGLTISAAQKQIDALTGALQKEYSSDYPGQNGWRVRLIPLQERLIGNVREPMLLLLGAVGLVLFISCANVANLLLARGSGRAREMGIRRALGAGRSRLTRQLLTESLLLSVFGGIAGLTIVFLTQDWLLHFVPDSLPRLNEINVSWAVLLFALAVSIICGVVFGIAPALQAGSLELTQTLNQEGRNATASRERARTRRALVVTEFALSLVLLIAATLLLRSFWDLLNVRLGFNPQSVMVVRTRLPAPNDQKVDKYPGVAEQAPFVRELVRRCSSLPGVDEVAMGDTAAIPLDESLHDLKLIAEGQFVLTIEGHTEPTVVERCNVTPEYFHLLGIPLLRGRLLNDSDTDQTADVAVINQAMAQQYWPNESALGKRLKTVRADAKWITVVGIVADARTQSLAQAQVPQIYLSLYQTHPRRLAILLRGRLDATTIPDQVRAQVQAVDPTLPVHSAQMLSQTVADSLAQRRFSMEMIGLFAMTALLLAALGIYGVMSYSVTQRTHEIGIRLALGADARNIIRMILGQGLRLAVCGVAVGLTCALVVTRLMSSVLYGVRPNDPAVFVCVAALLFAVAVLASYLPARRAAKVNLIAALRDV